MVVVRTRVRSRLRWGENTVYGAGGEAGFLVISADLPLAMLARKTHVDWLQGGNGRSGQVE